MLKAQRLVLTLVSVVLLALWGVLCVQNLAVEASVQVFTEVLPHLSLGLLLGVAGILLGGAVALSLGNRLLWLSTQQKQSHRELERKDVSQEEAQERVKVLESKIQTLEKALSEALKK